MASSQKSVRFRGSSLSTEEFEKARAVELKDKNSWVRSACFQTIQERAGKTVVRDEAGFIEVPENFVEPVALLKKFRRKWNQIQKAERGLLQGRSNINKDFGHGPVKIADVQLDRLINISKTRPDLNDKQRQYLHDSIEYWWDRSERKQISY